MKATVTGLECQPMVGRALDQMSRVAAMTLDGRGQPTLRQLDAPHLVWHDALGFGKEHELIEPIPEQYRALPTPHHDLTREADLPREAITVAVLTEQLGQRVQRVYEDGLLRRGLDL